MNARFKINVLEATRLTREGRLDEAMAVLRGADAFPPSAKVEVTRSSLSHEEKSPLLDMTPPKAAGAAAWTMPSGEAVPKERAGAPARFVLPQAVRDVVGRMNRPGSGGLAMPSVKPSAPLPEGATFAERNFTNEAGSRTYKLYIPSRYRGEALPLVVMLHGCTQTPDDFAAGTRMNDVAEEHMFLVAYPAQPVSANPSKCWNWFSVADQKRDGGEPSLIAGITRQIMANFPVDPRRVYIAGLSAGGAAAAILGETYPDLYAAVGVHSGLACGAATDMPSAFAAMRQGGRANARRPAQGATVVPTIVFHGDRDSTVHPVNGNQVIAQAKAGNEFEKSISRDRSSGGISYTRIVQRDRRGRPILEQWILHGAAHAWSGGSSAGSYTEPRGPDSSREMVRFFLETSNTEITT